MRKLITAVVLSAPLLILEGCTTAVVGVNTVAYEPVYSNDYVYTVGYYNSPFWGNNYYYPGYGYGWGDNGYWGSSYYNGY